MDLLRVYMRDGWVLSGLKRAFWAEGGSASTANQTAALLNAQSVHLDVLDVSRLNVVLDRHNKSWTGASPCTARMAARCSIVLLPALPSATAR